MATNIRVDVTTGEETIEDLPDDAFPTTVAVGVSAETLVADGTDEVLVEAVWSWGAPPETVDFDVNGTVTAVAPEGDRALLVVTATEPGFIDVTVEGQTVTLEAVSA